MLDLDFSSSLCKENKCSTIYMSAGYDYYMADSYYNNKERAFNVLNK